MYEISNSSFCLGIDTSNYTTSAAISDINGIIIKQVKKLLPVRQGSVGVRQSEAVFLHTKQLPEVISDLFDSVEGLDRSKLSAVGYSARPRDVDGSYMPCFTVGKSVASVLSAVNGIPAFDYSHQAGHVAAAVYGSGAEDELSSRDYLAFHVSGGTTEILKVDVSGKIELIGGTLDLNAGQLIDRVGVELGIKFPCGAELEKMALRGNIPEKTSVCVDGCYCNLSGFENKAKKILKSGISPEDVAAYTVDAVKRTVEKLTENALTKYGSSLPVLYSGGVMSCKIIREYIQCRYNSFFAPPEFSSDNAAGIALLCSRSLRCLK